MQPFVHFVFLNKSLQSIGIQYALSNFATLHEYLTIRRQESLDFGPGINDSAISLSSFQHQDKGILWDRSQFFLIFSSHFSQNIHYHFSQFSFFIYFAFLDLCKFKKQQIHSSHSKAFHRNILNDYYNIASIHKSTPVWPISVATSPRSSLPTLYKNNISLFYLLLP